MGSTTPTPAPHDEPAVARLFLTRILPALFGLAALMAFVYVGIGYLAWKRSFLVSSFLGNARTERLRYAYAITADTFLPGDFDGDGVSDGLELFYGTNHRIAQGHPNLEIEWDRPGLIAYDYPSILPNGSTRDFVYYDALPQASQPLHLRGRLTVDGLRHHIPTPFRLRVTPPTGAALSLPGGPVTADRLLVPMDAEGRFAFDLHRLPEAVVDEATPLGIIIASARTGQRIETVDVRYLPTAAQPLPASVIPSDDSGEKDLSSYGRVRTAQIQWPAAPAGTRALLLQAARPEPDAPWVPIQLYPPDRTAAIVAHLLSESRYPYTGQVRYRILPLIP